MLAKPAIYKRLMSDLSSAGLNPENIKWVDLEKQPYFWAILQECLRMMPGVSHRSARTAREEDLHYRSADGKSDWIIPRGTAIGMTSMINHWNTEIFPNPDDFIPERWLLEDGSPNYQLQKKLIAFGKGSRACIGEK
jgi:cytochrome P450